MVMALLSSRCLTSFHTYSDDNCLTMSCARKYVFFLPIIIYLLCICIDKRVKYKQYFSHFLPTLCLPGGLTEVSITG